MKNTALVKNIDELTKNDFLSHGKSVHFMIRKHYKDHASRIIHLPNIINFLALEHSLKKQLNYPELKGNDFTRMEVNLQNGEFSPLRYKQCIEKDFLNLVKYEHLFKLDIKSFYDSIYTHTLQDNLGLSNDTDITRLNNGETNRIIKGPYTSLFLAELFLEQIINKVNFNLQEIGINFQIEYFSDDIYIFSSLENETKIINVLSKTLGEFKLEYNTNKIEIYDYQDYLNEMIIDKYWNTIIRDQKNYQNQNNLEDEIEIYQNDEKYLIFLNQLVYRKHKLTNMKHQSIFINGFWKSKFFVALDTEKYIMFKDDFHKIMYIYREHPESILLYSIHKFYEFVYFKENAPQFFIDFFRKSLKKPYQEEQLYYYYGLYFMYGNNDFLSKELLENAINSKNQILISILVEKGCFDSFLDNLLTEDNEFWYLNYHIILRMFNIDHDQENLKKNIHKYLVPKPGKKNKTEKRNTYFNVYFESIVQNIVLFNEDIQSEILSYLDNKKG